MPINYKELQVTSNHGQRNVKVYKTLCTLPSVRIAHWGCCQAMSAPTWFLGTLLTCALKNRKMYN